MNRPIGASGDWMENFTIQSTGVHILLGFSILLVAAFFATGNAALYWTEGALYVFVLGKEYWYDLKYETGENVKSSTVDALGYFAGNLVALGLVLLKHHLG